MDVQAALAYTARAQHALATLAMLSLTSYLFPEQATVEDGDAFDFIIVGAGTAGSVIADRLSECSEHRVLVIDAGGDPPIESLLPGLLTYLTYSKYDWNFTSEAYFIGNQKIKSKNITSGHVLGGSGSVDHMFYARGCPDDYDTWAEVAHSDEWAYKNVLPYFVMSERLESADIINSSYRIYHGTNGYLGVTRDDRIDSNRRLFEAFQELGNDVVLDVNGKNCLGYSLALYMIADGIRQTNAYTNLAAHKERRNLFVLKNTLVDQILFDENNNAVGVKVFTASNETIQIIAKKEVIVSAGAINTPKLLMLSGIGPKEDLEALDIPTILNLPVGMNLQDHSLLLLSLKMEISNYSYTPINPHLFPFASNIGYVTLNESQPYPDYQAVNIIIPNDSASILQLCAFTYGYDMNVCELMYEANKGRNITFTSLAHLNPKSRGRIALRSKNPREPPVISLNTYTENRDLEDMIDYIQDYLRVLNTSYLRDIKAEIVNFKISECSDMEFASRAYWACYIPRMTMDLMHLAGTCPLGAVVDSRLRVRRANRLRVADASVMPNLVRGNPRAAVIVIAEKLSHMLKKQYYIEGTCKV